MIGRSHYFGAIVGRDRERICGARFTPDGDKYALNANDGDNSPHSGVHGFDKLFWQVAAGGRSITLTHVSNDGEEGGPGELVITLVYTLPAIFLTGRSPGRAATTVLRFSVR